jgi:hypothetical protein
MRYSGCVQETSKTFRHNLLTQSHYPGIDVVSTRTKEETIRYLVEQLQDLKTRFIQGEQAIVAEASTFQAVHERVRVAMDTTATTKFVMYLQKIRQPGIGPKKATQAVLGAYFNNNGEDFI